MSFAESVQWSSGEHEPLLEYPGAPLAMGSPFYIARPLIEQPLFRQLEQPGSLTRIRAPRQWGKTSLLFRAIHQAHQLRYVVVIIDFEQAESSVLADLDQFLGWFCSNVSRQLGITTSIRNYWEPDIGSKVNCTLYIQNRILNSIDCPTVFFLRHIDALLPYPAITQEFFLLMRGWFEDARWLESWQKLRLVLTHTTEIYVPLKLDQSPFNVGLSLRLPEFNRDQVVTLAQAYGLKQFEADQALSLMKMVGGHPYLIAIALYHLARGDLSQQQLLGTTTDSHGIYKNHLRGLWAIIRNNMPLCSVLKTLLADKNSWDFDPVLLHQLESTGVVKVVEEQAQFSCQLYQTYFAQQLRTGFDINLTASGLTLTELDHRVQRLEQSTQAWQQLIDPRG